MAESRDFAWLRRTLCDEIEAVRNGTADHTRAKSVAALAAAALKSVEVEALLRQQHVALKGENVPALGALPLCEPSETGCPEIPDNAFDKSAPPQVQQEHTVSEACSQHSDKTGIQREHEITAERLTQEERPRVTSPIVPQGARFIPGRASSGSR